MQNNKNQELGMLFQRVTRHLARLSHRHEQARHTQKHVLALLTEQGALPQSKLQEILDVRSSSLSEILSKLEKNGLITRTQNEEDRRSYIIMPTEAAKEIGDHYKELRKAQDNEFFHCLSADEQQQLTALLTKITASLEERFPHKKTEHATDRCKAGKQKRICSFPKKKKDKT